MAVQKTHKKSPSQRATLFACTLGLISPITYANPLEIIEQLGWISAPQQNLCRGYFKKPLIDYQGEAYNINAEDWSHDLNTKITTFSGDVVLKQQGSTVQASQAKVRFDDEDDGSVIEITLTGDVQFTEQTRTLAGSKVHIDYAGGPDTIYDALYLLREPQAAWGTSPFIQREDNGNLTIKEATYSTCAPDKVTWQIYSKRLEIDEEEGVGKAYHTKFYLKGVPIFYSPYLSFPTDDRRKSGFLIPTIAHTRENGFDLTLPYYLNLAPNYDFTFFPRVMTNRGVQAGGEFRFLTERTSGVLYGSYLPDDNEFKHFRQTAAQVYGVTPFTQPFLDDLKSDSNNRGYVSFAGKSRFNARLSSTLDINYTTDDYYFQDFGSHSTQIYEDQLLNQFRVDYASVHWQFNGLVQAFQTLHLIDTVPILDQYQRLPQLNLHGYYPQQPWGMDYEVDSEFVYFTQDTTFTGLPVPDAKRFHIRPSISHPIVRPAGYLAPRVQLDVTSYDIDNAPAGLTGNTTRVLPMIDIDSGLFFDREVTYRHKAYLQTIEPRLQYLYIPYENQNDIPLFDTFLPTFSSERFFALNRFSGFDRLGDNNRLSLALTSRLFEQDSGNEKVVFTLGQAYYFDERRVCLTPMCTQDTLITESISPIISLLKYNLTPNLTARADYSWDPNLSETQSASASIRYQPGVNNLIFLGYTFERQGDVIDFANLSRSENDLSRAKVAVAKSLTQNIHILGHFNYNVSHEHSQSYSVGVEYQGCCIAIRGIYSQILRNESLDGETDYDTAFYLQFQLKGLGTAGANNPSSLLKSSIPGYTDKLRR